MKHLRHNTVHIILLVLLFSHFNLNAKEANDALTAYSEKNVAKHTWVIPGPRTLPNKLNQGFMNNPAFVITDKSVIVFDPGSSLHIGNALIKRIKTITNKPITDVFISHIHGDHWLAIDAIQQAYPKVSIYAHPEMIDQAKAGEGGNWIALMSNLTEGATDGTKVVIPNKTLSDQQIIRIDDINIKVHLSKISHTNTDVMFQVIEDKVLITGDNTFHNRMPRMDDGSFAGNIKTMEDALALDIEHVVPGHGPVGDKKILKDYKDLLSIIYEEVKILLG